MSISEEKLHLAQVEVDVVRKDIKNMYLSVYPPTGRIDLSVPTNTDKNVMRLFALSNLSWIKKQIRILNNQARETPRVYTTGESHYFEGKRYLLKIVELQEGQAYIELKNLKRIHMHVKPTATKAVKARLLREWYRAKLKESVPRLLEKWETKIGVKVNDWRIKSMKTKWGSGNIAQKRIWINLELAKKPTLQLEYIIVHELVHLLEGSHNERFVAYLNKFMPKWRTHRTNLNRLPLTELLED